MSDVVELYDEVGSSFHYVDRFGFQQIDFEPSEPTQDFDMKMQLWFSIVNIFYGVAIVKKIIKKQEVRNGTKQQLKACLLYTSRCV